MFYDATFAKMRDESKDSKIKEKTLLDLKADKLWCKIWYEFQSNKMQRGTTTYCDHVYALFLCFFLNNVSTKVIKRIFQFHVRRKIFDEVLGWITRELANFHVSLKNKMIGVTCHNSIKLVREAIKNQASYIALGAFYSTKTKKTIYKANIKILKLVKKITNIPIVAIGGINLNNYKKLLLNKANFLAISSYVWDNKKFKPLEAIKKLKWKYLEMKLELEC